AEPPGAAAGPPAEPGADLVHDVLGEAAEGGELAADDRQQPVQVGPVVVQDVAAGDVSGRAVGHVRQGAYAGVGVQDVARGEVRGGEEPVGLGEDVVDLLLVGADGVEVAVEPLVGAADEVAAQPGDHHEGAAVAQRLVVHGAVGRAGERVDDEVGALGAADQPLGPGGDVGEHAVGPRPGHVDGEPGAHLVDVAGEDVAHACPGDPAVRHGQPDRFGVVEGDGAGPPGGEHDLHAEAFGVGDLRVVVERRSLQAVAAQAGQPGGGPLPPVYAVAGQGLVEGQHVVQHHAGAQHQVMVGVVAVEGQHERQRGDQVGGVPQQPFAVA